VKARLIILNGTGGVGKNSVARALQTLTVELFLHITMNAFLDMLLRAMIGHPGGVIFETVEEHGKPSVIIKTGPMMQRTMRGMRCAIASMADQGQQPHH
jgi:chloramphenicol 3-O phosphotransferase